MRQAETDAELEAAARIRADAYYQVPPTVDATMLRARHGQPSDCIHLCGMQAMVPPPRFVQSLARQWASDEFRGLVIRTSPSATGPPDCLCLVAVSAEGEVVGTLDLRPATRSAPSGVPNVSSVWRMHFCWVLELKQQQK